MKRQPGKDMVMYGGASIARSLMELGFIDEYRLLANPVILGSGKPLFRENTDRINLKPVDTKTFKSGVVLLRYQPAQE